VTRRLLLLAPFSPRLDAHHGGSRAIGQLAAALAERHRVAVLYLRGPGEDGIDDALRSRCDLVQEVPHAHPGGWSRRRRQLGVAAALLRGTPLWVSWWRVPAYAEHLRRIAATWLPDVVQLEFHLMGQYLPALEGCPAARVLVEHDPGIGSTGVFSRPRLDPRRLLGPLERRAWLRYERAIIRGVDAVVAFTGRDREALAALAGNTAVVRIPLGAPIPAHACSPVGLEPSTLLFVGSFTHHPNADAAVRLLGTIFPALRAHRPDARLVLVGANLPPHVRRLAGPGVEITGPVPDVTPYLDRASVVVIPLRQGGGMRVKALEALAAGKAILASPLAMEGLGVESGRECVLATSDAEFVERAGYLLDHADERRRLGVAARSWAIEHLQWDRVAAAYEELYRSLLEAKCRTP
jgi:glycosyltransferase involved in cell wall biosynthesis